MAQRHLLAQHFTRHGSFKCQHRKCQTSVGCFFRFSEHHKQKHREPIHYCTCELSYQSDLLIWGVIKEIANQYLDNEISEENAAASIKAKVTAMVCWNETKMQPLIIDNVSRIICIECKNNIDAKQFMPHARNHLLITFACAHAGCSSQLRYYRLGEHHHHTHKTTRKECTDRGCIKQYPVDKLRWKKILDENADYIDSLIQQSIDYTNENTTIIKAQEEPFDDVGFVYETAKDEEYYLFDSTVIDYPLKKAKLQ